MLAEGCGIPSNIHRDVENYPVSCPNEFSLRLRDLIVNAAQNVLARDGEVILHPYRREPCFLDFVQIESLAKGSTRIAVEGRGKNHNSR
jgi:hypothetical protein